MPNAQPISRIDTVAEPRTKEATVFGVPIGRLGLLSRVLISGACGFIGFLATFFLAILGVALYDTTHRLSLLNLDIAYRYIAAPAGVLALLASFLFLVGGWVRGKFSQHA